LVFVYKCGELKLVSYGRNVSKFGITYPKVHDYVLNSGLLPLCNIGYEVTDKNLLSVSVER